MESAPDREKIREDAEAETAALKAVAAAAKARSAVVKAQIGEVPSSGYTGEVTLKDKAGTTEAALLAVKAIETAAQRIVDALSQQITEKSVLLYAAAEVPNFQARIAFCAQLDWMRKAFKDASALEATATTLEKQAASEDGGGIRVNHMNLIIPSFLATGLAPSVAGLALEAVNKLFGFFRTDYTVGGTDLALEDSLLVHALAGRLTDKSGGIYLPAVYSPNALNGADSGILDALINLAKLTMDAPDKVEHMSAKYSGLESDANRETDTEKKNNLRRIAEAYKDAADAWKAAMELYNSYFNKLMTADDKGSVPLTNVIRESNIAEALLNQDHLLLLVKLQTSGGSYYTQKGIWWIFRRIPLYHMGGVVASFVLLDGKTGRVLKSGVVPVHGGFVRANKLPEKVNCQAL